MDARGIAAQFPPNVGEIVALLRRFRNANVALEHINDRKDQGRTNWKIQNIPNPKENGNTHVLNQNKPHIISIAYMGYKHMFAQGFNDLLQR